MSDFYTSVTVHNNFILVNGYLNGKRYKHRVKYKPYFFVPVQGKSSAYRTLEGKAVEKLSFNSIKDARNFYHQYDNIENFDIYGLEKFVYTYINDEFKGSIEYDPSIVVVHNLDIETDSTGGFADINTANKPITLIGIGVGKDRIIFGYKENYTPKSPNVIFIKCKDEVDMLRRFIKYWSDDDYRPDVVTGWNVEKYDIPYLVNRIVRLLGEGAANNLSPWKLLREKQINSRGQVYNIFIPVGVVILDYYDLYRKFTYTQQESYALDHIAFVEVGKRKLDFSEYGNLQELYNQNFEKYVDYNITDINRVYDIDEKNKFLELVYAIAYDAKVNFIDALGSVLIWDVIIHNYLMERNIVVPRSMRTDPENFPGGYVKHPPVGLHEWIVSFDLQSLYPHLIMQYNISPETHVGHIDWDESNIQEILEGKFKLNATGEIQAANGSRFTKSKHGFLPELMKLQFRLRLEYKNKMLELKKSDPTSPNIQRYHNLQMAKKIQLNSAYGALANEYFRYYDWRLASAITMSGQLAIRWIEKKINKFLNYYFETKNLDYILAMDTDSCYIKFQQLTKLWLSWHKPDGDKIAILNDFCENYLAPIIQQGFEELAKTMNAYENAMVMKRDVICDKVIWTAKKRYILNIWDQEGVRYKEPYIKYVGIEAVRSVVPQKCKDALKETIKIILNGTEKDVNEYIDSFMDEFEKLSFEDIAFPRGITNVYKYHDPVTRFKKGAPVHQKAAIVYNEMIRANNLETQYPLIYDRDKIKFVYLKTPNPSHSPVIGAPRILPSQLRLDDYIDRKLMFEKTFLSPVRIILDAVGYTYREERNTIDLLYVD